MPCSAETTRSRRRKQNKSNSQPKKTDVQVAPVMISQDQKGKSAAQRRQKMLTLEKFEEASEIVKNVTLETKLMYSEYPARQEQRFI